jgi:phosphomannomutase
MDCYRTCDIRGKYPEEVHEDLFFHFGRAIALNLLQGRNILIGSDLRPSSPALRSALAAGLVEGGASVLDGGQAPTPVVYSGKRRLGTYAAAVITASHNPPEDNGLKLMLGKFPASASQLRGLKPGAMGLSSAPQRGRLEVVDLLSPYIETIVGAWKDRLKPSSASGRFVFDPGNGTWSLLAPEILSRLGISATFIHAEPDGRFPHRSPDCAAPGSLAAAGSEVRRLGARAGLAWDGDGDRLAVCDDTGRPLMTDQLALLLLPALLRHGGREKILFDVKMSRRVPAAIESLGGVPVEERSAHCFLETRMIREDCLFGCEFSGHYFYRALSGGDDGMHAALQVVEHLLRDCQSLSRQVDSLPPIFITPDLRIAAEGLEFAALRDALRSAFPQARISEFDGLRVEIPGAWLLVRPSVSENKISFRFEGETRETLDALLDRALERLPRCRPRLEPLLALWRASHPA